MVWGQAVRGDRPNAFHIFLLLLKNVMISFGLVHCIWLIALSIIRMYGLMWCCAHIAFIYQYNASRLNAHRSLIFAKWSTPNIYVCNEIRNLKFACHLYMHILCFDYIKFIAIINLSDFSVDQLPNRTVAISYCHVCK